MKAKHVQEEKREKEKEEEKKEEEAEPTLHIHSELVGNQKDIVEQEEQKAIEPVLPKKRGSLKIEPEKV